MDEIEVDLRGPFTLDDGSTPEGALHQDGQMMMKVG